MLCLLALGSFASGATLLVPDVHPTLAAALAHASAGDDIRLAEGTWTVPSSPLTTQVTLSGVGVSRTTLRGTGDTVLQLDGTMLQLSALTLNAEGTRRGITCNNASLWLDDVVIREGSTTGDGGLLQSTNCSVLLTNSSFDGGTAARGGLIHADSGVLTIADSSFHNGSARTGGALRMSSASLWMARATFEDNAATHGDGGALMLNNLGGVGVGGSFVNNVSTGARGGAVALTQGSLDLTDVSFDGNHAGLAGGGVHISNGTGLIARSTFSGSDAPTGGGVRCIEADCTLRDNLFLANTAGFGGGFGAQQGTFHVERNRFCDNRALEHHGDGGGGALATMLAITTSRRNLFAGNDSDGEGGALWCDGTTTIDHDTYVSNRSDDHGSAVAFQAGTHTMSNSIVLSNPEEQAVHRPEEDSTASTTHTLFWNNHDDGNVAESDHNLFHDPLLVDPTSTACDAASFQLLPASPAIDAGLGPNESDGTPPDLGAFGGLALDPVDADGDGVPAESDCDDTDDTITLPALWFPDTDSDGFGDWVGGTVRCGAPGLVANAADCNDTSALIHPGATEVCGSGVDEDCDGVDTVCDGRWYADVDGDGFGDPTTEVTATTAPAGTVSDATDCDDTDDRVNPAADERCNGVDDDCDGAIDIDDPDLVDGTLGPPDADGDGYGAPDVPFVLGCVTEPATDCDDTDASINPGATEVPDNDIDEDCSGTIGFYTYVNGASCTTGSNPWLGWLVVPLFALRRRAQA